MRRFGVIWRLARADLRGGLRGFRVFVLSLALGALVIAAAGAAAQAFRDGLSARAREIIGGDLIVSLPQRQLSERALAAWSAEGRTAFTIETRAMAEAGEVRRLVDVRGYGPGFPLEGRVELAGGGEAAAKLAKGPDGLWGALVEQGVLDSFRVPVGAELPLARGAVRIMGVVAKEPDSLGRGFALSPRVIVAAEALPELGLASFGSLYGTAYRLVAPPGADLDAVRARLLAASEEFEGRIQDRREAAPGLSELIDRLESFLDFVGLSALLAGGIGVAGSVRGWLAGKRASIATLKTLGASSLEVETALLLQVALLALASAAVGAALGGFSPMLIARVAGEQLPLQPEQRFYWGAFASAVGLTFLAALAFAMAPVGAGKATPPSALFRGQEGGRTPWPEQLLGMGLALALVAAAALASATPGFTAMLGAAAIVTFLLLAGLGRGVQLLARRLAGGARGVWRLALAGLGGPSSLAPAAAPALGLGVALLCALAQGQANLVAQVEQTAPQRAPSIVFTEIPAAQAEAFDAVLFAAVGALPDGSYGRAPIVTARVSARNGAPIDPESVAEEERWFVESDLGVSTFAEPPGGQEIVEGAFWRPADPEPQVSIEVDAARGAGFRLGDILEFEVAGIPVEAKLTSLRRIDWSGFGANFVVLFSPGVIDGAVARHAAIARLEPAQEEAAVKAIAQPFPTVTVLRVRDALAAAAGLFRNLRTAIEAVAAVAISAGALAVAGAVAAGARRRVYEGAVLRALGATRGQVLAAVALELALAGAAAAAIGAALGFGAAYPLIVELFEAEWRLYWPIALGVIGSAIAALGLAGGLAGWLALSQPPARTLKEER